MKGLALAAAGICLCGCGRYADFELPPLGEDHGAVSWRWEPESSPVLSPGAPGDWDAVDALNPSIVRHQARYYNFYSGYDGKTWHTGLATSPDGIAWTKRGRVLSPDPAGWEGAYIAANGSALFLDGMFLYWYQAGDPPRIGLARSRDGRSWEKAASPVLETGPRGSWDERGVADPYVFHAGGAYYMYYLGQDRARRQRLGLARSEDGVTWWKLRSNPVLELGSAGSFDEVGLGEPAVWALRGRYWMLYTGRDAAEHRRLGLASSADGVRWQRASEAPIIAGSQPWDAKVVCDPAVEVTQNAVRVWFGGGDIAHPAENIHGQIGLGILRLRDANLTK
jgi:predicted GH43/DUF377 family glycosyl hydrolase